MRRRGRTLFIVTLFVLSICAAQLVRLQWVEAAAVAQEGRKLRMAQSYELPAKRGVMTDMHGTVLADNMERHTVVADPQNVKLYEPRDEKGKRLPEPGGVDGAAAKLAPLLGMSVEELKPKLQGEGMYSQLKRGLEPMQWRAVKELGIPGITSEPVQQRTYPGGAATAPLVGWIGSTGRAMTGDGGGLELVYDDQLTGTKGIRRAEFSRDGQIIIPSGESQIVEPVPGNGLTLTLDNDLQWYAYNAVAAQVQESEADWGVAVVMDTKGRLRAAAQYPGFDPARRGAPGQTLGSTPFINTFEPGSTAKVMSIGAALNEGVIDPATQFTVENRLPRADQRFRDARDHDTLYLTSTGILAVSSNIGTILIAEKLAAEKLEEYYRAFGMGKTSATSFPGESAGNMPRAEDLNASQRYTMMFGQGFAVTAIQDAGVFQAVANGGVRIPATVVAGTTAPDGTHTEVPLPEGSRVISEESARTLLKMMENVTAEGGTAVLADIPGYRVAGKTGTSDRYDDTKKRYFGTTVSFIGIVPADHPELICAVIIDHPRGEGHGGDYAAPVFKSVMTYALQRFSIPPSGDPLEPFPNYWGSQSAKNKTR